jgi:hypothetical protein
VVTVDEGVAGRLRQQRRLRGLTQRQLADRSHYSASLVKQVEQGTTPPSDLYGTDERDQVQTRGDTAGIAELRTAVDSYDDPRPEGDPLSLATVARQIATLGRRVYGQRSAEGAGDLAHLIHHLYVLSDEPGHAGEQGRALLHDAYRLAASVAGRHRAGDLAAIASERHVQLAPMTGDPLRVAVSAFHRSTRHLQFADYRGGIRVLERARTHLDTTADGRAIETQFDLRAAVLAARSGDVGEADDYVTAARSLVDQFAPPHEAYLTIDASPVNVLVHWCAAPVENYDGAEALRRAAQVRVVDRARPERVAHHHIDMARASLLHGDRDQVLAHLNEARRVLPEETRRHPSVRETVLALAATDRRSTGSLAGFARWAGITL